MCIYYLPSSLTPKSGGCQYNVNLPRILRGSNPRPLGYISSTLLTGKYKKYKFVSRLLVNLLTVVFSVMIKVEQLKMSDH